MRKDAPLPVTPRQKEVVDLHNAGKSDAEIAELLGITRRTVKSHRSPSHIKRANGKGKGWHRSISKGHNDSIMEENKSGHRKSGWPAYTKRMRAIPGYRKYESIRRDASRESRKQLAASNIFKPYINPFVGKPMTIRQVTDSWGLQPLREWLWKFVDYSKHEIEENG